MVVVLAREGYTRAPRPALDPDESREPATLEGRWDRIQERAVVDRVGAGRQHLNDVASSTASR